MPNILAVTVTAFKAFQNMGPDVAFISQDFTLCRALVLLRRKRSHSTTHQQLRAQVWALLPWAYGVGSSSFRPMSHLSICLPETLQTQPGFLGEWSGSTALSNTSLKTLHRRSAFCSSVSICFFFFFPLNIQRKIPFPINLTRLTPSLFGKEKRPKGREVLNRTESRPCHEKKIWDLTQLRDGPISPL